MVQNIDLFHIVIKNLASYSFACADEVHAKGLDQSWDRKKTAFTHLSCMKQLPLHKHPQPSESFSIKSLLYSVSGAEERITHEGGRACVIVTDL